MFNLNPGVDLDEVVAVLLVYQELGCAGITISNRAGKADSVVEDRIPHIGRQVLGGGNLDDLLVSPLDGAVTLVEVDNITVVVTEKLDLDVLGLVEEPLDEDGAVAEGALGLGGGSLEGFLEGSLVAHDTHATTATTIGGLDDDGEAILVSELLDLFKPLDGALGAGNNRDLGGNGNRPGRDLVTKGINRLGRRTDELECVLETA
jgi:hypothetical protein